MEEVGALQTPLEAQVEMGVAAQSHQITRSDSLYIPLITAVAAASPTTAIIILVRW